MNAIREEQLLRAIKATADLVGYSIKKVATGDDLKTRTMTIAFETPSSGHVQEQLDFERVEYHVNGRGEVTDLQDLTEKDETSEPPPAPEPSLDPVKEPADLPVEAAASK